MQWFKYLENLLPKFFFLSTFSVCRRASCLRCVLRWGFTQASISAPTCRCSSWYDLYFLYFLHLHILYSVPLILVEFLHELQKEWSWFLNESPISSTILPMTRLVEKNSGGWTDSKPSVVDWEDRAGGAPPKDSGQLDCYKVSKLFGDRLKLWTSKRIVCSLDHCEVFLQEGAEKLDTGDWGLGMAREQRAWKQGGKILKWGKISKSNI